jgi:hypothetical protein
MRNERAQWKLAAAFGVIILLLVAVIGIVVVGGVGFLALASSGDSAETGPGSDVSDVRVSAEGTDPGATPYALDVTWNTRAQSSVQPDPSSFSSYNANDGEKLLVVRMEITNTGAEALELTRATFKVRVGGVGYDSTRLAGSGNSFTGTRLQPDATYRTWLVYSIPEGATDAQLVATQDGYYQNGIVVEFEHDSAMPINMSG